MTVSFENAIITEIKAPSVSNTGFIEEPDFIDVRLTEGCFSTTVRLKGRNAIRVFRQIENAVHQQWKDEAPPKEMLTTKIARWCVGLFHNAARRREA
jgi:hypothetical protein